MDLFLEHVDLVSKIVNKMNYHFASKDDLLQAGLMGLYAACKNYDSKLNVKFNTYATFYILGEIKRELKKTNLIRLNKEMFRIIRYLKDHQEENIDEVARKLDVEREQVMSAYLFQKQIISLNNEAKEEELLNFIEDKKERKSSIYDALDELDEEEREIIVLRYFQNFTQIEIAQKLDKNQSKISRMESQALSKMRKILLSK